VPHSGARTRGGPPLAGPGARPTLAAIAAEAGVSLPTVSKVVNGRADVAPATRARVERLLDELNYRRPGVRSGRRSGLVDLVFNGLDSPWAVEILRGVEDWCAEHEMGAAVSAVRHGSARPDRWTPTTSVFSISAVRLGPVANVIREGSCWWYLSLRAINPSRMS